MTRVRNIPAGGVSLGSVEYLDDRSRFRVSTTPYGYEVSKKTMEGHTAVYKTGLNIDVDNVEEVLWSVGGAYVFPTGASNLWVKSSSADDAASGTGVRSVTIHYLDPTLAERAATVILMGTTPLQMTETNIYRINAFRVKTTGTGKIAAGDIDVAATGLTPIYSRIPTGATRGRNSVYTVPYGKVLFVNYTSFSVGNASGNRYARFDLKATYDDKADEAGSIFYPFYEIGLQDGAMARQLEIPFRFPAGVDIKLTAISDAVNADAICTGSFRGWLEDA